MSGIYIHIPFCRTACHYCDFHFSTSLCRVDAYVEALLEEIKLRSESGVWSSEHFETLYLGGGTPSILSGDQTHKIVSALQSSFNCSEVWSEATIEVNPEDVTESSLEVWLRCGFNRLSIGVQSFQDSQLKWMNRQHSGAEALSAVTLASKAGFSRISVDLIYGVPHRLERDWADTVDAALELPIDHISCYALTVEPKTVLGVRVAKGIEAEAPDSLISSDYDYICKAAPRAGMDHYEVSNWSKDEASRARHNSSYWAGKHYMGLGAGAHGFLGKQRYSVVSNNPQYIKSISQNLLPDTLELLSDKDRSNEMLMTGLRTSLGVDLTELERTFGINHVAINSVAWDKWNSAGVFEAVKGLPGRVRLNEKAWIIGDSVASDLFVL